jgi:L-rhamnose mutarotase
MIDLLHQIAKRLPDTCKGVNTIHWLTCKKGHRWQAAVDNVRRAGHWCPNCARKAIYTIEDMQKIAAERGGKCLSAEFINSQTKLLWECIEGHQWEATPATIKQGTWCPNCAGNVRSTIEDMQKIAMTRGGKCLSDVYVNSQTKLLWECIEGHQWEATPNKIKSGRWCPNCANCANKLHGDSRRLSIEEMVQIAKDRSGRCLSQIYINNRTKLLWECSEGHRWEAVPAVVKKGHWCHVCFQIRDSNRSKRDQIAA